ncbi:MAG: DUF58 domain-containing protein [Jatrophihabitans sp.]
MSRGRLGFTTRASSLLAAGITAVVCGLLLGETDLVRAGVLVAAVPIAAAVVVHRSRVRVANRRAVEPLRAQAGQSVTAHLTITNRSLLPTGALMLEDQLPDRFVGRARFVLDSLGSHEARTVSYRMPNLGRGRYRAGPLRIRLSDPFHMIDLTRSFTATTEFLVTPVIDLLPAGEPPRTDDVGDGAGSHSIGTHGADDASTREYRIGDDLRKIHWRSSARTGALMVRQEERPWRAQTTVLLDLRASAHTVADDDAIGMGRDPRQTSSLEWAVSAVASVGSQALHAGRDVGIIGDPERPERMRFTDNGHLVTYLACVRETHGTDLTPLTAAIRASARDSSLVAVLGRLDPPAVRLLADAHPRGRSSPALALLLDVDSWTSGGSRTASRHGAQDVDATAAVLRNSGWRVTIVRCGTDTPEAWRVLLSGLPPTAARNPVLRR